MTVPRRPVFCAATLAMTLLAAAPAHADTTAGLFVIERSKNANEVHYDAHLVNDGHLDPKEPVVAYWVRKAEDGSRDGLSWIQKQLAYGFDVKPDRAGAYTMTLVACSDRPLHLVNVGGRWRAELLIGGKKAYLTKLFVQSDESGIMPTVQYVDMFGEIVGTGAVARERLMK